MICFNFNLFLFSVFGGVVIVVVVLFLPFNELDSPDFVGMLGIFQLAWDL